MICSYRHRMACIVLSLFSPVYSVPFYMSINPHWSNLLFIQRQSPCSELVYLLVCRVWQYWTIFWTYVILYGNQVLIGMTTKRDQTNRSNVEYTPARLFINQCKLKCMSVVIVTLPFAHILQRLLYFLQLHISYQ